MLRQVLGYGTSVCSLSLLPQGVAITFGKPCYVRSACVYGGAPKGPQIRDLQDGMFVCVCVCAHVNVYLAVTKACVQGVDDEHCFVW